MTTIAYGRAHFKEHKHSESVDDKACELEQEQTEIDQWMSFYYMRLYKIKRSFQFIHIQQKCPFCTSFL
jgi:hypothetical protein